MTEDKKQPPVPEAHTAPEAPAPETPAVPASGIKGSHKVSMTLWEEEPQRSVRILAACGQSSIAEFAVTRPEAGRTGTSLSADFFRVIIDIYRK